MEYHVGNKYIVYKAFNIKNGKTYVGITTKTLKERQNTHKKFALLYNSNKCRKFYNAIRKYGFNNFIFKIIDKTSNINKLYKLEQVYIKKYNSIERGYNITEGGRGNIGWIPSKRTRNKISKKNKGKLSGNNNPSKRKDVKITLKQNNIWNNPKLNKLQNKLSKLQSERMKKNNPMKKLQVRIKMSQTRIKNGIAKGKNNPNYRGRLNEKNKNRMVL